MSACTPLMLLILYTQYILGTTCINRDVHKNDIAYIPVMHNVALLLVSNCCPALSLHVTIVPVIAVSALATAVDDSIGVNMETLVNVNGPQGLTRVGLL